jgi:hypothetical protein
MYPIHRRNARHNERQITKNAKDRGNMLVSIWGHLTTRTTTKPEDLHGLLAVMLGPSALEILNIDAEQRMQAILRSQKSLPMSMLYFPYPQGTSLAECANWVPLVPSGDLSLNFGTIAWDSEGSGLEFRLFRNQILPIYPRWRDKF